MQIVPATFGTVHYYIHPFPVNRSVFLQGDPGRGRRDGSQRSQAEGQEHTLTVDVNPKGGKPACKWCG